MPDRRANKHAHESFWISAFIAWHQHAYRSRFEVVAQSDPERPSPPDAIIQSGRRFRWIEVGSVYWTKEWATDLHSHAASEESHRPIRQGIYADMDENFATEFCAVLANKIGKRSYEDCYNQYGPGYLVLPMMSPFFTASTVPLMRQKWATNAATSRGYFRGAFLAYRDPSFGAPRFRRWRLA